MLNSKIMKALLVMMGFSLTMNVSAQQATAVASSSNSYFSNPLFLIMLSVITILLIVLYVLGGVIKNVADYKKSKLGNAGKGLLTVAALLMVSGANAQQAQEVAAAASNTYGGLDAFTFWSMLGVIIVEIYFLISLLNIMRGLIVEMTPVKSEPSFLDKFNASVSVENEDAIMFDHEYDGIRELDNDLPPWWKYGFYVTIIVAVIYLIHFHVLHTGPSSAQEYDNQVAEAKILKDEYMKNAANNIDETNVVLADAAGISEGKNVFMDNCAACHGRSGEGVVGPNLTDDYWLHGGVLADVFKTIKYGVPEKGMKSWQAELTPQQIQNVSSFIKSIHGTNPANAKAPQGQLVTEKAVSDSLAVKKDSVSVSAMVVDTLAKKAK